MTAWLTSRQETAPQSDPGPPGGADRWAVMLLALAGEPPPPLPAIPGRRITARDEPLSDAELAGVTSPTELALLLGIPMRKAQERLRGHPFTRH